MPFADPTSVYLENLARRRAQAELYGQQFGKAAEGLQSGLGQWNKADIAQQESTAAAEKAKADAAQAVEALRIKRVSADADKIRAEADRIRAQGRAPKATPAGALPPVAMPESATVSPEMADALAMAQPDEREPGEIKPEDVEGVALSPEASDILMRLRATTEPGEIVVPPEPTSGFTAPLRVKKKPSPAAPVVPMTGKAPPTAPDWESIDKQDARKLREAKTSAVGAVDSAKAMLAILDDPEKAKFIGKYRGAYETLKEDVGIGSEASGLRAGMAARFNEYKNRISGAAVSDKEKPDLTRVMPDDIDINPDDLRQKLIEGIKYAERQRDLATKVLGAGTTKVLDQPSGAPLPDDPQAAFMQVVLGLSKQLGRKPTKQEIQDAATAAGVVIK